MPEAGEGFAFYFALRGCNARLSLEKTEAKAGEIMAIIAVGSLVKPH
jgi:hypothetical protein